MATPGWRSLAAFFGFLLLLAGCGTNTAPAANGPSIDTRFGPVTVPENPQRVVALGWSDAETALALGVQPVGVSDWQDYGGSGVGPWAAGRFDAPPTRLGTTEINYEALAALEPDLILNTRSDGSTATHETLSKIAPTVGPPPGAVAFGTGWREQMRTVSQALGKPAEGEQRIAEVEGAFAATAREYPQLEGKTVALAAYYGNKWAAYVEGDPRVDFMTELGLRNKPEINDLARGSFFVDISHERLDLLSADLTVVFAIGGDPAQLRTDPVLNGIESARAGNLVILEDPTLESAFSSGSTLGIQHAIHHAAPLFAERL